MLWGRKEAQSPTGDWRSRRHRLTAQKKPRPREAGCPGSRSPCSQECSSSALLVFTGTRFSLWAEFPLVSVSSSQSEAPRLFLSKDQVPSWGRGDRDKRATLYLGSGLWLTSCFPSCPCNNQDPSPYPDPHSSLIMFPGLPEKDRGMLGRRRKATEDGWLSWNMNSHSDFQGDRPRGNKRSWPISLQED